MSPLIACRIASYGPYQDAAWEHLPSIGIRHVEIEVPQDMAATRKRLADHGLTASSLQGKCDIKAADAVETMKPQLDACRELGAAYCFLSVNAGEADRAAVYRRLAQLGAAAEERGVTVVLETHPDLITNGEVAHQTMRAVNHPGIRVNFDTANVYYYNEGVTTMGELNKVIDDVGAVHLKDTNGQYKTWHFPALGEGVVDFPAVFKTLGSRGFTGPYTMELEGVKGVEYDREGRLAYIAASVDYLRKIGVMNGKD